MSYLILSCGSQARGDANPDSDHDFVCLHDGLGEFMVEIKRSYPQISFISLKAVERMKSKGALFLTHLDLDGDVIEGEEKLLDAVRGYKPSAVFLHDSAFVSQCFIKSIRWFPAGDEGFLWLCDVLFVALRNFIYCKNAMRSQYFFGYVDAAVAFGVNSFELDVMLNIRDAKYAYRKEGGAKVFDVKYKVETISEVVGRIVGEEAFFKEGGSTEWACEWGFDYWGERFLERAIINGEIPDNGFRDMLKDHNYNKRVLSDVLRKRVCMARLKV